MVTAGAITKSELISQPWDTIYTLIDDNITDPIDSSNARKWVYSREPSGKQRNFAGYPYIIIKQPKLEQGGYSLDRTKSNQNYEQEIEVRCSDNMVNSAHTGKGLTYVNQVTDDVLAYFGNPNNKATLRDYGHYNLVMMIDNFDTIIVETETVFRAIIRLKYGLRLTT